MIVHLVLFEPKPDLTDIDRRELLDGLAAVARACPAVRRLRVGRRVKHNVPGYEQMMRDGYSFAAIVEFDTIEDLRSYLHHPAHERVGKHFTARSVRALAYDYELVEIDDAAGSLA